MPNRISLIMSGAVSLGDYHAGVLTELLYALDCVSRNGDTRHELDVITGASAGSITGAIVAFITLQRKDQRGLLRQAWVELADIDGFLQNAPNNSLLSRTAEGSLAGKCIKPPYDNPNPADYAPVNRPLRMSFTLANLNGVNRQIPGNNGTPFDSTFFDDVKTYYLVDRRVNWPSDPGNFDHDIRNDATWQSIIAFGITSGAFPFAFPPFEHMRQAWEFDWANLAPNPTFSYVDGGTFNNQPIGEAVRLSRIADGPGGGAGRKYLFVSASADNSKALTELYSQKDMVEIATRLATCIFAESRVSDYLRAQLINFQTTSRDTLFAFVHRLVVSNTLEDHGKELKEKLAQFASDLTRKRDTLPGARNADRSLDERLAAVKQQYSQLAITPAEVAGTDPSARNEIQWLLFLILDHVADLDSRQPIDIDIIAPKPNTLAGEQFAWFGGFFKQEWREFNFRKGRIAGHQLFLKNFGSYDPEPGNGYTIPPDWERFPTQSISDTDPAKREAFRDRAVERAIGIVESVFKLHGLLGFVARKKIQSVLTDYLNKQLSLT